MNLHNGGYSMPDDTIDPTTMNPDIDIAVSEYKRLIDMGHTPEEAAAIVDTMFGNDL